MKSISFQVPQFSKGKIIRVNSYITPYRKQGMRIQHQFVNQKHLIHNYGHGNSGIALAYGAAFIAIKAIMIKIDNNKASNVALLGTGPTAIMTAIQLLKRGFRVTLYSNEKFKLLQMDNTTQKQCNKGHTIWFPDNYDYSQDLLKHQLISKLSWDYLQDCLKYKRYRSINEASVFQFNKPAQQLRQLIPDIIFDNFKQVKLDYGNGQQEQVVQFNTLTIDNSLYLQQLKTQLILRGGKFVQKKFTNFNEIFTVNEDIIVNCLGAESGKIFNDQKVQLRHMILVDLQFDKKIENKNWNLRVHLENDSNFELTCRNGNIKILLPPKQDQKQNNQAYIQKQLFKLDSYFKIRQNTKSKL